MYTQNKLKDIRKGGREEGKREGRQERKESILQFTAEILKVGVPRRHTSKAQVGACGPLEITP